MRVLRTLIAVCLSSVVLLCVTRQASAQDANADVALRAQDRAVVRVYSQRSFSSQVDAGFATGQTRITPVLSGSYGTGFVVSNDGLIVTAHHVVENAFFWLVIFPGSIEPHAAVPVYVDTEHDIAVLKIDGTYRDVVTVPARDRALAAGETISVAGYPREFAQRTPAVTQGIVSRVTNDGKVEASMAVNEGDSGGPVCDRDGRLVGLMIERGDPDQGLQGIAIFQPLRHVRNALLSYDRLAREAAHVPNGQGAVTEALRRRQPLSQALVNTLAIDIREGETDAESRARVVRYLGHAEAALPTVREPEDAAIAVSAAWDAIIRVLERHQAVDVVNLEDLELRRRVASLVMAASELAERTVAHVAYFVWNLVFLRDIAWQHGSVLAMPLPQRAPEQTQHTN